jgi:hypothetical protein
MSEHTFSHGPDTLPPPDVLQLLERIAAAHGLSVVTYPARTVFDPRWAFTGPSLGRAEEHDLEDRVRTALAREPVFRLWCVADRHAWVDALGRPGEG